MIADKLDRLALAMLERPGDPRRTILAAAQLGALAAEVRELEEGAVPPHLRVTPADLPAGVTRFCGRRAAR